MQRPIFNMLQGIQGRQSLHMPAHHGSSLFGDISLVLDTTEFALTDNLYQAKAAIAEAQALLSKSCGVHSAYFLHNGSTAGIQSMLLYARHKGNTIIVQRNSHVSVFHFAALLGLDLLYIPESYTADGVAYLDTEVAIDFVQAHQEAVAVLLTSPNYYGICVDIEPLAKLAHALDMLVLVDEAHGAHLNWSKQRKNAGYYGADIFVQSAHKTLACTTSCAWLLNATQDADLLQKCLQSVQTTSPSFLNILMMDDARAYMDTYADIESILALLLEFEQALQSTPYNLSQKAWEQQGLLLDKTRLVIQAPQGGFVLQEALAKRGMDVEMADENQIICILSLIPKQCKVELSKLLKALQDIPGEENRMVRAKKFLLGEKVLPLHEAYFAAKEESALELAEGKICGDIIAPYPPGVPLLLWGERIKKSHIAYLESLASAEVLGLRENKLWVIKE